MDLTKREKIGLTGFIIIIVIFASFLYFRENASSSIEVIKDKDTSNTALAVATSNGNSTESIHSNTASNQKSDEKPNKIYVYITGEVKHPGVYVLIDGDRVEKLVQEAGGVTAAADMLNLNLASKLKDEDHIVVYTQGETGANARANSGKEATLPITSSISGGKININTADKEQLKELPRIGDAISQRIIDYREQNGKFNDIKDITNVSGIGTKMFDSIKDKICVQ